MYAVQLYKIQYVILLDYLCRRCCFKTNSQRSVHCGGINWPPNHPDSVALIKRRNKRRGCEPGRKQSRDG